MQSVTVAAPPITLHNLQQFNVLLGKNGCGKSTALKYLHGAVSDDKTQWQAVKYITPERGGSLEYDASVEMNITNSVGWLTMTRLTNQNPQFKQQTLSQYRNLEVSVLRAFEADTLGGSASPTPFTEYVAMINLLLDNVELQPRDTNNGFQILNRKSGQPVTIKDISSGESELIALCIEVLIFTRELSDEVRGLLLLDEPDVHLHPDLQARFMRFLTDLTLTHKFDLVIATHSTAILGQLSQTSGSTVCTMKSGDTDLKFEPIDNVYVDLLPVFGAHPLTQVFANAPSLLVEGEDDVRIWQQAVRTSNNRLRLYPVECRGKGNFPLYEGRMQSVMQSVYDGATAYSLRDRDELPEAIQDMPPLIRMRLSCRAAENLLLSSNVLDNCSVTWEQFITRMESWTAGNPDHPRASDVREFLESGPDRKNYDLKNIRMIIVGHGLASEKPWEVLVGQAIAQAITSTETGEHSIRNYLGNKTCQFLLDGGPTYQPASLS